MKRRLRWELMAGLTLLHSPGVLAPVQGWPVIQPLHAEYKFVLPEQAEADTPFIVYLLHQAVSKVYKFECHRGAYDDTTEMSWSGDFQCALFPYKIDTVSPVNLLATDTHAEQSVDWRNRGRMIAVQLQGECLQYPEYSTLRHFRLRGMDVTLSFADHAWEKSPKGPRLMKFTFTLDAAPDQDAKTPVAEAAEGPSPPKACYP